MARKGKPAVHKPVFDEDSVLRFAALGAEQNATESPSARDASDRQGLKLMLKPEIIKILTAEAARKEKTVDQVVAKLVSKHLGK